MKTDKISEALKYVTLLWNMQQQDIRGKCVLDYDALIMTNKKQQLFIEADEQLAKVNEYINMQNEHFLILAINAVIDAHERGEIPTFNDQGLREYLTNKKS